MAYVRSLAKGLLVVFLAFGTALGQFLDIL